jgi:glycosyltransferase involved in cell wall biosynthesis
VTVPKILHVIPSVGALRGGPSAMVRNLARDLSQQGIDTHVATTDDNGPQRLDVPWGVPVVEHGVTYWYFPRQTRLYSFSWPLGAWLAKHVADFDLLHIHALFSYASLPAAFWAHRLNVPYVVRPLGTLNEWGMQNRRPRLKRLSFRMLESRIIRHAALMHYTSDRERIEAESLRVAAPAVVIPNLIPEWNASQCAGRLRARFPQLRGRPIVLYLSRIDQKKGLDLLLAAFAVARRQVPDAMLVVAGDGPPRLVDRLHADAASLGIAADVLWTGFLAGDDKDAALADADVFVLPSRSENFGIAVAEAMAAGLPVIVSDRVGIHEEIAAASAGLVVRCEPGGLARAMTRLLTDPRLRASLGGAARSLALRKYSSRAVTTRLIGAYNSLLS